ncbi:bifunctional 2-polyprenyl-6-hydroxyphenol methylase/3-demethylubiquinol 3-O-methyltransferase UbiG [Rhodobacter sp. SY28-1]|uniref:class I SAM-dependent methyltransferase n=1 Tax=Rhodobacter sp. SY28-1 TaxID=2562317 RepID=UPI0010C13A00|nr:methyltransferase domain-containing protein [Rhodobacter sp. SY28-1]
MVASVLTSGPVEVAFEISRERLASLYMSEYGVDVRPYIGDVDPIVCYRCIQTGFEFFAPAGLAGPPKFYADLYSKEDNESWAYQKSKWEYTVAARFVGSGSRVLDVGCGGGDFLATLGADVSKTGLETSRFGQEQARAKGITVVDSTIEDFAPSSANAFDVVSALQVLEHIADPLKFLQAIRTVLVPGGRLVIAVPNNDAFLGAEHELTLNLPPHHMGRWQRQSLEALAEILQLKVEAVEYEPLAEHNLGWYKAAFEKRFLPATRIARSLWHRLGYSKAFEEYVANSRQSIHGHTILAVYSKPEG